MSIAGIRSNRGDSYQTLVALDWALTVLSDPEFAWIEIDSITHGVDDVIVGKTNGATICCQCKKNEPDFKAWTVATLGDELDKAAKLLSNDSRAEVYFYSRSSFSPLAKLKEYCATQPDAASYQRNLSQELQSTNSQLSERFTHQALSISSYEFLARTRFEISPEFERIEGVLLERLRQLASNSTQAYLSLWARLDQLGARFKTDRLSSQHRLSKDDLKAVLQQSGAMLTPPMLRTEIQNEFASMSCIGRHWRRTILDQSLPRPTLNELLTAIDTGKRSILLTGSPGSGKTCVMLELQETLEARAQSGSDFVPIFIQSREFADFVTDQERQAQGLPEKWVEKIARLTDEVRVIVVIDSLDVLSIAREHQVLRYFLAQIDRLLTLPKVTVVTSCRSFDRHYERDIATRQWDCELTCQALDWETEIRPLLTANAIATVNIDTDTRTLIANPRELDLFLELARHEGGFNVVTSKALAQRYLDKMVRNDPALGENALQAIENIAEEMLKGRSLSVVKQRVDAPVAMQRHLLSLNVLQQTQDQKLTFGHQTLLDVLIIQKALLRRNLTLNEFIQGLAPVPFVRPSIRSFIEQLAVGDRLTFRRQLRTVLTGKTPFHIRRLVAESFAEQVPNDTDWGLISDLRRAHPEVFQVIYMQARKIEWHYFWLQHLVPLLHDTQDIEGLTRHVYRVAEWIQQDTEGVVQFWEDVLSVPEICSNKQVISNLFLSVGDVGQDEQKQAVIAPLLKHLLSFPRIQHSFLGRAIARCVAAGAMSDDHLWQFISSDLSNDDVLNNTFDSKLYCQTNQFGDSGNSFLCSRMEQSVRLLDLALASLEQWNHLRIQKYSKSMAWSSGFLGESSYKHTHTKVSIRHEGSIAALLSAIEHGILSHAKNHSAWWVANRERLSSNQEGALRYFGLRACTEFPLSNLELIGQILSNNTNFESKLSYEYGTLIEAAFIHLEAETQTAIIKAILESWAEHEAEANNLLWILRQRVMLLSAIPCHLRSDKAQAVLADYERTVGIAVRQPSIEAQVGWVSAPFSFEVFLRIQDQDVLRLLGHYQGYQRGWDDSLVGGEYEVGQQLCEAASRQPTRFLTLLTTSWTDIGHKFHEQIVSGISNYLEYIYGNLQPNPSWVAQESPTPEIFVNQLLTELECHPARWHLSPSAARVIYACSYGIFDLKNAERLIFLGLGFTNFQEASTVTGAGLLTTGWNMRQGNIANAMMNLANQLLQRGISLPDLLPCVLRKLANLEHPAIHAVILGRLAYLQSHVPELGWELFDLCMRNNTTEGLWVEAEACLYYASRNHFTRVAPWLKHLARDGKGKDLEVWGRISALAVLSQKIDQAAFMHELEEHNSTEAWAGAAMVWTEPENMKQHRNFCLTGLEAGLNANALSARVIENQMATLCLNDSAFQSLPVELFAKCFDVFEQDTENQDLKFFEFGAWLNTFSHHDPNQTLFITERYLAYVAQTHRHLYDHNNHLAQLLTRLFDYAQELEESDDGATLRRVVSIQDQLIALGVSSISAWLKAAER